MSLEPNALIAALGVMVTSLVGVFFSGKVARSFLTERLSYLISFSAGVFLVTSLLLGFEVFEMADSVFIGIVLIVTGYILAWGIQAFFPETHHHHDDQCTQKRKGVRALIIGDSIHNMADGIVIVSAFAVSPIVGVVATVSIILHETLQEIAEYFVLRQAGHSAKRALLINFSVSSTVLIGVLIGQFALMAHDFEVVLLALSAGFFSRVVIHDLLPKPGHHETRHEFFRHLLVVIIGSLLMGSISYLLDDAHTHDDAATDQVESAQ